MQTHQPINPNAASAPPVARPLSDFSLVAQFQREVHVETPKTSLKEEGKLRCCRCGTVYEVQKGFYLRQTRDKSHQIGSAMQPCKTCYKLDAKLYRLKKKERKQNDGR